MLGLRSRYVVATAIVIASVGTASAQPIPLQGASDPTTGATPTMPTTRDGSGATKIPVTMTTGTEVLDAAALAHSAESAPVSLEQPVDPDTYTCGSGDLFELNFWGQQNFRLQFGANLEGRAFISKVGFVTVAGKTLAEVRKDVRRKVGANYPGLNFELTLARPRSFIVHVVDFVTKPGSYAASPLERLSVVLERAGGVTGSRRRITIRHHNGTTATADLVKYELTGATQYNPFLLDGDVVDVPATGVVVGITGAVRRPGTYELTESKDLAEALVLAGGLTSSVAYSLPIRLVRLNEREQQSAIDVPFSGTTPPSLALQDQDAVEVRQATERQRTVLIIGAVVGADPLDAATTSKRLPYFEGDTVLSLLTRAGGITATGDLRRSYITRAAKNGAISHVPIDLEALLVNRDYGADQPVHIDDTIVVPPVQYSVLVEGAVVRAGMYPFNPQFGIAEYIAHAGGRTRTAVDLSKIKLIDWNGTTHDFRKGLQPSPGDSILVPERNFTRAEVVQIVIAGAGLLVSAVAIGIAASR